MPVIYTIGHSNRSIEEFVSLLKKHGITCLVDVRRFPTSKFEHFKKEKLASRLARANVRYVYLGNLLGGFRQGGYEEFMKSEEFRAGLKKVVSLARKERLAIMCSELLWFKCHRRFISDELCKLGFKVIHIVDKKRFYEHKVRSFTRVSLFFKRSVEKR